MTRATGGADDRWRWRTAKEWAEESGGHSYWFNQSADGRTRFVYDDAPGQLFDGIIPQRDGRELVVSDDQNRAAYYGVRAGQPFVGYDDRESPAYSYITRSVIPTFSPDGSRFAYGAMISGVPRVVLDGEPIADWIAAPVPPVFSPSGKRFAFVAASHDVTAESPQPPRDYRQWVVVDGHEDPPAPLVAIDPGGMVFSPSSDRFAYIAVRDGRSRVVEEGVSHREFAGIESVQFSPDGRRLVYFGASSAQHVSLVEEGRPGPEYQGAAEAVFSADSRRLGYWAVLRKDVCQAVIDGSPGPEFADAWGRIAFSPDGNHHAYLGLSRGSGLLGRMKKTAALVIDGVVGQQWDEVASSPHWSPDGRHVAFTARRGKEWSVVIDQEPIDWHPMAGAPRYSTTGKLAYLAQMTDGYAVVFDGVAGPLFHDAHNWSTTAVPETFLLSPDGEHVVTAALIDGLLRPIVDDSVGPPVLAADRIVFESDLVTFLVIADRGPGCLSFDLNAVTLA